MFGKKKLKENFMDSEKRNYLYKGEVFEIIHKPSYIQFVDLEYDYKMFVGIHKGHKTKFACILTQNSIYSSYGDSGSFYYNFVFEDGIDPSNGEKYNSFNEALSSTLDRYIEVRDMKRENKMLKNEKKNEIAKFWERLNIK